MNIYRFSTKIFCGLYEYFCNLHSMGFWQILLYPLSLLYGVVMQVRNKLFDLNILKSHKFSVPVISVGNLSTGGTGKTPTVEYLVRLLSDNHNIAVLSRGYKRSTKGFLIASGEQISDRLEMRQGSWPGNSMN